MPKKKAKRKVYFGQEVQDAIIEYNSTESSSEKNIISFLVFFRVFS